MSDATPIRVIVVAPEHAVGGQAHAARQIVRGFQSDHQLTVTLQPSDPSLSGALRFLTATKFIRSIVRPLITSLQLASRARTAKVFHVFCAAHTAFLFGTMPALLVAKLFRCVLILNYHDGRASEHFRRSGSVLRWALRQADAIVVPSNYLASEFSRHGFRAIVIPNVVDANAFAFVPRDALPLRLISTRLLEPLYAVENTLAAFEILLRDFPGLQLDIYGDGVSASRLRQLAGERELKQVIFHGAVAHAAMPAVLGPGGVMVNSSRVDNTPLFVLEAFAAGLPIVSTAAGGIPYLVEHGKTGLLVPIDDPAALAAAIRRLFCEPGLASSLVAGGRREVTRYSWPVAQAGWRELYCSLALG